MAFPDYDITEFPGSLCNESTLHGEIVAANITEFSCVTREGDTVTVSCSPTPSASDQATIDGIVAAHDGSPSMADPINRTMFRIWGSEAGLLGNNQTIYAYVTGAPAITATESLAQVRMPACKVWALSGNNYTHATDYTLTVRKNGAATAMTTGLVTAIQNHFRVTTGAPITFADGDLLALQIVMATGGAGSGFRGLFLELELT